jgi:hypothetical protein
MTDAEESLWSHGHRAAWVKLLDQCLRELGYDDVEARKVAWVKEREAAIAALRSLCRDFGDNEWDEHLHLADVIDKHLGDHLHDAGGS